MSMDKFLYKYTMFAPTVDENQPIETTWGLLPVAEGPILEGFFDPVDKRLVLTFDSVKDYKSLVPIYDKATAQPLVDRKTNRIKQQIEKVQKYHEIVLQDEGEISDFLTRFCINN